MRIPVRREHVNRARRRAQRLARRTVSVGYRSIVVPLLGRMETEHALGLACRVAAARGAHMVLVAPLLVDQDLPLDAQFEQEQRDLRAELDEAAEMAKAQGIGTKRRLVRTRERALGRELAELAHDYRAQLMVVGAPVESRRGFRRPFPPDVFSIVRDAPCRVMIVSGRVVPRPAHDVVLRKILVPLKLGPIGREMVASAIKLARDQGAAVEALVVLAIPLDEPIDAPVPDLEERAAAALAEAALLGSEHGVEVTGGTVRARSIGSAIVDAVGDRGADLVVLGSSPRWRRSARFFSPTVEYVLRRAPAEVLVVAFPEGSLGDTLESS